MVNTKKNMGKFANVNYAPVFFESALSQLDS